MVRNRLDCASPLSFNLQNNCMNLRYQFVGSSSSCPSNLSRRRACSAKLEPSKIRKRSFPPRLRHFERESDNTSPSPGPKFQDVDQGEGVEAQKEQSVGVGLSSVASVIFEKFPEGDSGGVHIYGDVALLTARLERLKDLLALPSLQATHPLAEKEPRVLRLSDSQVVKKTLFLGRCLPSTDVTSMLLLKPKLLLLDFGDRALVVVDKLREFMPETYIALMMVTRSDCFLGPSSISDNQLQVLRNKW
eukprot:CAMPEP_0196571878 /NCGR_PEP_ID=MMETSP1081-20130531/2018_1 /TAXON_ID=36882 /ORGANISM="Pyramimonas amylifera, Strain CCMP720" /LENGTH=246 /DNA_ID=CAMNT_0041889005 /DNA_START=209 /DNA_END=946 /DNA_ORIENTATION=+